MRGQYDWPTLEQLAMEDFGLTAADVAILKTGGMVEIPDSDPRATTLWEHWRQARESVSEWKPLPKPYFIITGLNPVQFKVSRADRSGYFTVQTNLMGLTPQGPHPVYPSNLEDFLEAWLKFSKDDVARARRGYPVIIGDSDPRASMLWDYWEVAGAGEQPFAPYTIMLTPGDDGGVEASRVPATSPVWINTEFHKSITTEVRQRLDKLVSKLPGNMKLDIKRVMLNDRLQADGKWIESERILQLRPRFADSTFFHEVVHANFPDMSERDVEALGNAIERGETSLVDIPQTLPRPVLGEKVRYHGHPFKYADWPAEVKDGDIGFIDEEHHAPAVPGVEAHDYWVVDFGQGRHVIIQGYGDRFQRADFKWTQEWQEKQVARDIARYASEHPNKELWYHGGGVLEGTLIEEGYLTSNIDEAIEYAVGASRTGEPGEAFVYVVDKSKAKVERSHIPGIPENIELLEPVAYLKAFDVNRDYSLLLEPDTSKTPGEINQASREARTKRIWPPPTTFEKNRPPWGGLRPPRAFRNGHRELPALTPSYLPDSAEYLAQTIDRSGWRERLDEAFLAAIQRARS